MEDQAHPTNSTAGPDHEQRWAELADLVLIISREVQFRGYADERAIPLSPSEGMVMRYLQREPHAPPSRIADATGLQRTNLSTVLGGLERKGLVERRTDPGDGRGVTVHATELGRTNYALVRREWATAVSDAANHDTTHLDAALALLTAVETGLTRTRPRNRATRPATGT
ncbi:MarR family transcriptional regulator [Streptomyces phaeochromogenes]|uniref:MarR family winged helix-turn-helix transcriptional regulator n=1 Tax=Streptomyces phaeochromogenes TaxID=1923 RepID=UPI0033C031B5|nr:MarR family transcriptional regulator [Streptomyces phaeochromogenes]WSW21779.1 MarR family transcriptional regulator [Streptomyces phaeochromogenes]WTA10050.1 MarR family transcriptional regulator [Streptomyces phaeochromogenes]